MEWSKYGEIGRTKKVSQGGWRVHYVPALEDQKVIALLDGLELACAKARPMGLLIWYRTGLHAFRIPLGTANASHLHPLTKARQHPRASALLGNCNVLQSEAWAKQTGTTDWRVWCSYPTRVQRAFVNDTYPTSGERLRLISNIVPATGESSCLT